MKMTTLTQSHLYVNTDPIKNPHLIQRNRRKKKNNYPQKIQIVEPILSEKRNAGEIVDLVLLFRENYRSVASFPEQIRNVTKSPH